MRRGGDAPVDSLFMRNRTRGEVEQRRATLKRLFGAAALIVNGYLLLSFLFGDMGLLKFIKMKQTYSRIKEENRMLRSDNEELTRQIKALKTDPLTIERIARERLGLAREGELVYEFYEP